MPAPEARRATSPAAQPDSVPTDGPKKSPTPGSWVACSRAAARSACERIVVCLGPVGLLVRRACHLPCGFGGAGCGAAGARWLWCAVTRRLLVARLRGSGVLRARGRRRLRSCCDGWLRCQSGLRRTPCLLATSALARLGGRSPQPGGGGAVRPVLRPGVSRTSVWRARGSSPAAVPGADRRRAAKKSDGVLIACWFPFQSKVRCRSSRWETKCPRAIGQ